MPSDAGSIHLHLRVLLIPEGRDEVAIDALLQGSAIDGGFVDVELHVGTTPAPKPYTGIRSPEPGSGSIVNRDTQANEVGLRIGQATDPGFVPGVGTPADVARRGAAHDTGGRSGWAGQARPIRDSPQA